MLGLAVLFGLGLWLLVTIVAMVIGAKFGRKPATKLLGAFLGFMLTMGGFIVHWRIEYLQIQSHVTHLCKTEAGITTYVTPEEWKSGHFQATNPVDISIVNDEEIIFQGNRYEKADRWSEDLFTYSNWQRELHILKRERLLFNRKTSTVLMKVTYFMVPFSVWSGDKGAYKIWMEFLQEQDCYPEKVEEFEQKINLYQLGENHV